MLTPESTLYPDDRPVSRRRNKPLTVLLLSLLGLVALLAALQFQMLKLSMASDLSGVADVIAYNAGPAVVFGDRKAANALMASLATSDTILEASLVGRDQRTLATFHNGRHDWTGRFVTLEVTRPITAQGETVGEVILKATTERLIVWPFAVLAIGTLSIGVATLVASVATRRAAGTARRARESIEWVTRHDPLTGIANREALRAHLEMRTADAGGSAALYLIDVDDFSVINAAYGTQEGDLVLRNVAQRLLAMLGPGDLAARLGADEFGVVARHAHERDHSAFAYRLQEVIREPIFVGEAPVQATTCIGIALLPPDDRAAASALQMASAALAAAKAHGRGAISVFQQNHDNRLRERADLIQALRLSISRDELELHYQPIFDMQGRRIVTAEALLRWRHPVRGMVPPDLFIPIAESCGLIEEIGLHTLELLHQDRSNWIARGAIVPPIAINISSVQFASAGSRERFLAKLNELHLGPDCIEIELTERSAFEEVEGHMSIIDRLKGMGFVISLDDFGTGFSSLSYLHRINCDKIKVDRTFVSRIGDSQKALQLIRAIIEVARAFRMKTVAEGVETHQELEALQEAGCDAVQGYLMDRPLDAHGFFGRLVGQAARATAGRTPAPPSSVARAAE